MHHLPVLLTGKVTLNVVPHPGSLFTLIVPFMLLINSKDRDNPRPIPFSVSFVVKKGSNIFSRMVWGIPMPLSLTSIFSMSLSKYVRTQMVASILPSTASIALCIRLTNTCRNALRSARAAGSEGRSSHLDHYSPRIEIDRSHYDLYQVIHIDINDLQTVLAGQAQKVAYDIFAPECLLLDDVQAICELSGIKGGITFLTARFDNAGRDLCKGNKRGEGVVEFMGGPCGQPSDGGYLRILHELSHAF